MVSADFSKFEDTEQDIRVSRDELDAFAASTVWLALRQMHYGEMRKCTIGKEEARRSQIFGEGKGITLEQLAYMDGYIAGLKQCIEAPAVLRANSCIEDFPVEGNEANRRRLKITMTAFVRDYVWRTQKQPARKRRWWHRKAS